MTFCGLLVVAACKHIWHILSSASVIYHPFNDNNNNSTFGTIGWPYRAYWRYRRRL